MLPEKRCKMYYWHCILIGSMKNVDWSKGLSLVLYIYIYKVKLATVVEGYPKALFSVATTTTTTRGGRNSIPLVHFTLIMLSDKQRYIKYNFFFNLWYDLAWDWTLVSRAIGEVSIHLDNGLSSLSTSSLADGMKFNDPLLPFVPIIYHPWWVL